MSIFRFARKITCGCLFFVVLIVAIIFLALGFLLARKASAAALDVEQPTADPLFDIVLVSDQSVSMWDCDGVGSDPQMLRVDAVHLFVNYLGADSSNERFRLGLIHFGGQAQQMAPLTSISADAMRSQLAVVAADPQPIPWTDPLEALQLARELLRAADQPNSRRVIVLLTDGEPAWPDDAAISADWYKAALRELAQKLAAEQTTLFVVQLTNPNTTCNQRMIAGWMNVWREVVAVAGGGTIQTATRAADLLPIYHTIVRDLIVRDTGKVAQSEPLVEAHPLTEREPFTVAVTVDALLTSMTLVILKQDPDTRATIWGPLGMVERSDTSGVSITGDGGKQEIWRFLAPAQGLWQVVLLGRGEVTVWQDRIMLLPTPTPLPTNTPTATSTDTPAPPTSTPTVTHTPVPPTSTPTATSTDTPAPPTSTPTATSTDTPAPPTATLLPRDTPTATMPPIPVEPLQSQTPWWVYMLGGVMFLGVAGAGSVLAMRHQAAPLRGTLTPVRTPDAAKMGGEMLSIDLGSRRLRRLALGAKGKGQCRLPGWNGSAYLESTTSGQTRLVPKGTEGAIALNGAPLIRPAILRDGDLLTLGEYRLRYENLL